jgi:hypothetical protein
MKLVLNSLKEYCKNESITDAGARKRISQKLVKSIQLDGHLYIIQESNEVYELKNKIKILNSKIKELKSSVLIYTKQDEQISKLENKIEKLEFENEKQRNSKEELYEKIIGQMDRLIIMK